MKHYFVRIASAVLAVLLLLPGILPVYAAAPAYQNTYVNTGNQREDILGVALTQLGYREGSHNDTKYGTWNNLPYQPWCASFVSWCARQAEISTDILNKSGLAKPRSFGVRYYHGSRYTPKPGDLFFTEGFTHVGLVYKVEGSSFYSIEGNGSDDYSTDGFYVISNKRSISNYYFGVPDYEGCDKDHDYVREQESAHPHRITYTCTTCGDRYDTGYTAVAQGCRSCFSCGCSEAYAGYYLVNSKDQPLKLWSGHSRTGDPLARIPDGAVVYAYGGTANGWVHIEYDGIRGHVAVKNLKTYYAAPDTPVITPDQADYILGDDVTLTRHQDAKAEQYHLQILRNGSVLAESDMGTARSYTLKSPGAGEYEIRVSAANLTGWSQTGTLKVTVRDTYTVTYDLCGGTAGPADQTQVLGSAVALSAQIPVQESYTFLGWTDIPRDSFARYNPGDTLVSDRDLTVYAVWKDNSAAAHTLEIERMPQRLLYLIGQSLDTTGLALHLSYTDGSSHIVTEGFTAEGFCSDSLGIVPVTVTCAGLTVSYDTEIVTCIPGDINLDNLVTREDVMMLLWHIAFPDEFVIEAHADFNADGILNRDDVMQLLWHIAFPAEFPLEVPAV